MTFGYHLLPHHNWNYVEALAEVNPPIVGFMRENYDLAPRLAELHDPGLTNLY